MTDRSSFKSYIPELTAEANKNEKLTKAKQKMYSLPTDEIQQLLLPGELISGVADKVIKYIPHGDPARGMTGQLACTNFRVLFVTSDQLSHDVNELNNRLLGKQDIPLTSIDSIFVEYPNKRKRLVPGSKVKDGIQRLEIHGKDFRVSAFNFKFAIKLAEKKIIETILQYAYPNVVTRLFAFDYKNPRTSKQVFERSGVPSYRDLADWQELIRRHGIEEKWRVSKNEDDLIPTVGNFVVVPKSIADNVLKRTAPQFNHNRFPLWCWSTPGGASLIRAADLIPDTELGNLEQNYYTEIKNTNSKYSSIKTIDVAKTCATHVQIQQSFIKLKNMCLLMSIEEFYNSDNSWLTNLHYCKWMHHISTFLSLASDAVHWLMDDQCSVVIKESSGYDITPVLTSLVQLLADPSSRTILGFQSLIQREWVAGGFPFLNRLGHLFQPTKAKSNNRLIPDANGSAVSPVFLMFLDCVWQLTCQFPSSFEFTSTYLIALHDSTRLSIFDTFMFNNERARLMHLQLVPDSTRFTPVWDWQLQFDDKSIKLFNNPLYRVAENKLLQTLLPKESPPSLQSRNYALGASVDSLNIPETSTSKENLAAPGNRHSEVHKEVNGMKTDGNHQNEPSESTSDGASKKKRGQFSIRRKKAPKDKLFDESSLKAINEDSRSINFYESLMTQLTRQYFTESRHNDVLSVLSSVAHLSFWSHCYLRWTTWSHLSGGAPLSVYRHESVLYNEIHDLMNQMNELSKELGEASSLPSNDSGMYFHRTFDDDYEAMSRMSSYFPYVAIKDARRRTSIGTPFVKSSRASTLFGFNRQKLKHLRSSSDISVPTSCDDSSSSASVSNMSLTVDGDRKRSLSAQAPRPPKPPSQSSKPIKKVPIMPNSPPQSPTSKECVTYISSV